MKNQNSTILFGKKRVKKLEVKGVYRPEMGHIFFQRPGKDSLVQSPCHHFG